MIAPSPASGDTAVARARAVLLRDLDALAAQIGAYPTDPDLWKTVPGITNSGGTLALHLAGNLRAYVGAELGKTGYVRDRDAEFSTRGLSRAEVLARIAAARADVDQALARLPDSALPQRFPQEVGGARLTTGQMLLHLVAHFGYHLGQVDYHRRVATGGGSVPGMIAAQGLAGGA
jgi:hypothetical protein